MTAPTKPSPRLDADSRPFWEACRSHRLQVQQCSACGWMRWPPAFLCPRCHGKDSRWRVCSGKGRIYSYVVYHKAFHPAFKSEVPYVVAIVALVEGAFLVSNIVGCDPSRVYCEMPVEVKWEDRPNGVTVPLFSPVDD
jgi:uncharacterized protein